MNAHIVKLFPHSGRRKILVFERNCVTKFQGKVPQRGR